MIRISEIFGPTIQGEGMLIGKPTIFVRVGGCDYRCQWCDTMYAVDPKFSPEWTPMSESEILGKVNELGGGRPTLITLSGGNPALYDLAKLVRMGQEDGHSFSIETQGSVAAKWLGSCNYVTISPKPPSSGEEFNSSKLAQTIAASAGAMVTLKIPVGTLDDIEFACLVRQLHPLVPMYLQPVNVAAIIGEPPDKLDNLQKLTTLADLVLADPQLHGVAVLPQLHLLMWDGKRGT